MSLDEIGPGSLRGIIFRGDRVLSPTFAKIFLASALLSLAMTPPLFGMVDIEHSPVWERLLWTPVALGGPIGSLFLWFGMLRYWRRYDGSGPWAKRAWLALLLIGFWYGAILYYLSVYLPQVSHAKRDEA